MPVAAAGGVFPRWPTAERGAACAPYWIGQGHRPLAGARYARPGAAEGDQADWPVRVGGGWNAGQAVPGCFAVAQSAKSSIRPERGGIQGAVVRTVVARVVGVGADQQVPVGAPCDPGRGWR